MIRPNNFDHIAPFYDGIGGLIFGKALTKAPTVFFTQIPKVTSILVVGGGSGKILIPITAQFPEAAIHFYEPSHKMMVRAKTGFSSGFEKVSFHQKPLKAVKQAKDKFDLIITPFVLDLFSPRGLQESMDILYNALRVNGHWLQADFYEKPQSPKWQKMLLKAMHLFFRITTAMESRELQNFNYFFKQYNLQHRASSYFYSGMIKTTWYTKIREEPCTVAPKLLQRLHTGLPPLKS